MPIWLIVLLVLVGLFALVVVAAVVIDKSIDWIESGRSRFPDSGYDKK